MLKLSIMTNKKKSGRQSAKKARLLSTLSARNSILKAAAVVLLIALGLSLAFYLKTEASRKFVIVLPSSPEYARSWEPFLGDLARSNGIKSITIVTWSTTAELEALLAKGQKKRVLFAEVPVTDKVRQLEKKALLRPLESSELGQLNLYSGFVQSLKIDNTLNKGLGMPFTFDPWVAITRSSEKPTGAREAVITIPGKDDEGAAAAFGLGLALTGSEQNRDLSLAIISDLQSKRFFQHNAFTYNASDSFIFFLEGRSRFAFVPMSFLRSIPTQDLLELKVEALPKLDGKTTVNTIATGTLIVFPGHSKVTEEARKKLIESLGAPELIYGVAKGRNVLPALTTTKIRDFHDDNARSLSRNSRTFIFPALFMGDEERRILLLDEIRRALVTR